MEIKELKLTVPDHSMEPTSNPDLFRVVDRDGNWNYYFKKSANRYAPAVNHVIKAGFNKGPRFMQWLLSVNQDEAKKILESAGDRGTRVHQAIRDLLNGQEVKIDSKYPSDLAKGRFEPLTNEEWDCVRGFANWVLDYKPEVYKQEEAIFSDAYNFAGTIDFLGTVELKGQRIPILIDWKTSSGVWDEYKLQTAAYWVGFGSEEFKPGYTAIVRIGTKHKKMYEMVVFNEEITKYNFQRFMAVKDLCEFVMPSEDNVPVIQEIPVSFRFEVPVWKSQPKTETKPKVVRKRRVTKKAKK